MGLSCSCDFDYDFQPGDWTYWFDQCSLDFEKLETLKRQRCCSCGELISINSLCVKYSRYRYPYNKIEARIHNIDWDCFEEPPIKIAYHYHCEKCAEIWLNLTYIGYECLSPNENMKESLKEYQELIGFKEKEEK